MQWWPKRGHAKTRLDGQTSRKFHHQTPLDKTCLALPEQLTRKTLSLKKYWYIHRSVSWVGKFPHVKGYMYTMLEFITRYHKLVSNFCILAQWHETYFSAERKRIGEFGSKFKILLWKILLDFGLFCMEGQIIFCFKLWWYINTCTKKNLVINH